MPGRAGGGSAANGGELLCLALATCYCNDLYREAAKRGLALAGVAVEVEAEFGGPGEPARRITYTARVASDASPDAVEALLRATDAGRSATELRRRAAASCRIVVRTPERGSTRCER